MKAITSEQIDAMAHDFAYGTYVATRYHVSRWLPDSTTPSIASCATLDEALDGIADEFIDGARYGIEQCADIGCFLCTQAYADEQG
jgi:hypothetical protein